MAVTMAARLSINRTNILASSATNAPKYVAIIATQGICAAVVEKDEMHFAWAIELAIFPRAVDEMHVGCDFLAGGGAGEEGQKERKVLLIGKKLFNAHHRNVNIRCGGGVAVVAFVLHDDESSSRGNCEVNSAYADLRFSKFIS